MDRSKSKDSRTNGRRDLDERALERVAGGYIRFPVPGESTDDKHKNE